LTGEVVSLLQGYISDNTPCPLLERGDTTGFPPSLKEGIGGV